VNSDRQWLKAERKNAPGHVGLEGFEVIEKAKENLEIRRLH
jgi:hypothetical protein